jgi:hypothetical protein
LADPVHQGEALRSCEKPASGPPVGIDPFLYEVEEIRRVLDLVENDRRRMVGEEFHRIFERPRANIGPFEGDEVMTAPKLVAEKRRLSRLAWSSDEYCRKRAKGSPKSGSEGAGDESHDRRLAFAD